MAQINSRLGIHDGMSGPLKNMCKTMGIVISTMRSMADASGQSIDVAALDTANDMLARMNVEVDAIEEKYSSIRAQQNSYNTSLATGANNAGNLMRNIAGAVGAYAGLKEIVGLSDNLTGGAARLELIVDDKNTVSMLEDKIYASAQRARASYTDTMDIVAKLGLTASKAFSGNDEMIYFSELMAKNFVVGGASATEQASAMYQLTQAMSSGRLQGDEYRSIIENAPLLAKSIEDYMVNVRGATGSMKEWASEGLITSDVIKSALFSSADEIESRFADMPMTWGQIGTAAVNKLIQIGQPLLWLISAMAQNWSVLEPIVVGLALSIGGLAAATAVYNLHQKITNGLSLLSVARSAIKSGATLAEAAATTTATGAQIGLNAALLACPLTWILIIIIAVIAAIYAIVAAINKAKGTSYSVTGAIAGAFMWLLSVIGNILIAVVNFVIDIFGSVWNAIAKIVNIVATMIKNPLRGVMDIFLSFVDGILNGLQAVLSVVDTIIGTDWSSAVEGWRSSLDSWADEKFGKNVEIMPTITDTGVIDRIGNKAVYLDTYNSVKSYVGDDIGKSFYSPLDDVSDIADYTAEISDTLTRSEEELEYLRDIAERETINRFTTAEIKVDFSGMTNRIEGDADINGFIEALTEDFSVALATAAEGVS